MLGPKRHYVYREPIFERQDDYTVSYYPAICGVRVYYREEQIAKDPSELTCKRCERKLEIYPDLVREIYTGVR